MAGGQRRAPGLSGWMLPGRPGGRRCGLPPGASCRRIAQAGPSSPRTADQALPDVKHKQVQAEHVVVLQEEGRSAAMASGGNRGDGTCLPRPVLHQGCRHCKCDRQHVHALSLHVLTCLVSFCTPLTCQKMKACSGPAVGEHASGRQCWVKGQQQAQLATEHPKSCAREDLWACVASSVAVTQTLNANKRVYGRLNTLETNLASPCCWMG